MDVLPRLDKQLIKIKISVDFKLKEMLKKWKERGDKQLQLNNSNNRNKKYNISHQLIQEMLKNKLHQKNKNKVNQNQLLRLRSRNRQKKCNHQFRK